MSATIEAGLKPLCHVEAELAERIALPGTPVGTRAILEVLSLRMEGERLRASLVGRSAADWAIVVPDTAVTNLDVRLTVRTDDGALIFVQYNGRAQLGAGGAPGSIYIAPRFDTGDPRYAWLAAIQGVGKGVFDPATRRLRYALYELV